MLVQETKALTEQQCPPEQQRHTTNNALLEEQVSQSNNACPGDNTILSNKADKVTILSRATMLAQTIKELTKQWCSHKQQGLPEQQRNLPSNKGARLVTMLAPSNKATYKIGSSNSDSK